MERSEWFKFVIGVLVCMLIGALVTDDVLVRRARSFLQGEYDALVVTHGATTRELGNVRASNDLYEQAFAGKQAEYVAEQVAHAETRKVLQTREEELKQARADVAAAQSRVEQLTAESDKNRDLAATLQQQLDAATLTADDLRGRVTQLEQQVGEAERAVASKGAEAEQLRGEVERLRARGEADGEQIAAAAARARAAEADVARLKGELGERSTALAVTTKKLVELPIRDLARDRVNSLLRETSEAVCPGAIEPGRHDRCHKALSDAMIPLIPRLTSCIRARNEEGIAVDTWGDGASGELVIGETSRGRLIVTMCDARVDGVKVADGPIGRWREGGAALAQAGRAAGQAAENLPWKQRPDIPLDPSLPDGRAIRPAAAGAP